MCIHCEEEKGFDSDFITMWIEQGSIYVNYSAYSNDSSFEEQIKINYCPMCGKKL